MADTYAGYVSNRGNLVDWESAASGLSGAVKSVDDARKMRRAENERLLSESEKLIQDTEQPKSQTLNEFVLKGANEGKSKLLEWNRQLKSGQIDRSTYQSRIANLNEYWGSLANTAKTLDQRLTQAMQRQQVGEDGTLPPASAIEAEMQLYFGGLSQLKDKNLVIGDDGRVMVGKYSPDGSLISTEDVKYINNPANVEFNRTDLSGMVQADVKNWGDWSIGRVSDVRQNPQFKMAKARLSDAIVGTPRSAASVLVDNTNGEYQVYFNEQDKQAKLQKLKELDALAGGKKTDKELESQLILMQQDSNGDYQPNLTNGQLDKAKKLVENEIELQLSRKVEPAPQSSYNGPSWSDMYKFQKEEDNALRGYIASREGWTKSDFSGLSKGYEYVPEGGDNGQPYQVKVYKVLNTPAKAGVGTYTTRTLVKTAKNPEGLAEFAFDGDPNQALSDYTRGKGSFYSQGLQNTPRFQTGGQQKKQSGQPRKGDEMQVQGGTAVFNGTKWVMK